LLASILVLMLLPFTVSYEIRTSRYSYFLNMMFYIFLFNCFILGWIGSKDIVFPYYQIGQLSTAFYFLYFLVILPFGHKKKPFISFKFLQKKKK
jgi:ubiquinol-cytochrome c reductase cytochrome b subunit